MRCILVRASSAAVIVAAFPFICHAEAQMQVVKAGAEHATRQIVDDWVVACVPSDGKRKSCVMSQTLASKKLNQPVGMLLFGKDRNGKLKGSVRIPVGVSLASGAVVRIARQAPFTVPFTACHRIGCFAAFDMTESLIRQFKTAGNITVEVQSVSQKPLSFNFSPRGLPGAYESYLAQSK